MKRTIIILSGSCLVLGSLMLGACAVTTPSAMVSGLAVPTEVRNYIKDRSTSGIVRAKDTTDVYAGPGTDYFLKGTLFKGDQIKILEQKEDWVKCFSHQYRLGWIRYSAIKAR